MLPEILCQESIKWKDSYYAYKIFQQESLYFEDTEITDY